MKFFRTKRHTVEISPDEIFLDAKNISKFNQDSFEGQIETPVSSKAVISVGIIATLFITIGLLKAFSLQIVQGQAFVQKSENNRIIATPLFGTRGIFFDRNGVALIRNVGATTHTEIAKREYASFEGMAPLIGFVSYPKKDKSGRYWQTEYVGLDGLEKKYNDVLSGKNGKRIVQVDALGETTDIHVTEESEDGTNLTLTIDAELQDTSYKILQKAMEEGGFKGGASVILDIETGEILSLVSAPSFPLYALNSEDGAKKLAEAQTDTTKPFLNRAISGLYSPGSIVKPFIALAALEEDIISPDKQIESKGSITVKNPYGGPDTVFHDWKAHGYTDMRKAIAVSSDVYFYTIGGGFGGQKGLGIAKIDEYLRLFGFAERTGIDLPGESKGLIPTPEWKLKTFDEEWRLGNTYHTSIGQYGSQVTAIQMARSVASIANGGRLVVPYLVQTIAPRVAQQEAKYVASKEDLRVIHEGMRETVVAGSSPVLQQAGFPVAAKSGTAEIGVRKGRVNSWMTGFFPYQKPKYAFVTVLENGPEDTTYGAGKTTRDILKWIRDNRPSYAGIQEEGTDIEEATSTGAGIEEGVTPL